MKEVLEKLGYVLKTTHLKGGTDYSYKNLEERPYLLFVLNNTIEVIFESKLRKKTLHFDSLNDFIGWHNEYSK